MPKLRGKRPEFEVDERLLKQAEEFAMNTDVLKAWTAFEQEGIGKHADFQDYLLEQGLELPRGLSIHPLGLSGKPTPDYVPFTIRLSRCRTVYVADEPGQAPREQTVCFGFEIIPHPISGGPRG